MKKSTYISAIVGGFVLTVAALVGYANAKTTYAACSGALPSKGGTATLTINVPRSGNYRLWTHMFAPSSANNAVYVRVDDTHCQLTVGDAGSMPANQFSWVDYQNGNAGSKINLSLAAGNHTFTYAGLDEGVGIDKVILAPDGSCTPRGDGSNCSAVSAAPVKTNDPQTPGTQQSADPANDVQIAVKDTRGEPASTQDKRAGVSKNPYILVPLASVLLLASAAAVLWTFRPRAFHGLPDLLRTMLGKQPPVMNNDQQANIVVVSAMQDRPSYKWWGLAGAIGFGVVGLGLVAFTFAAATSVSFMLSSAQLSNGATVVNHGSAIGGKMVKFLSSSTTTASTPPPSSTPSPTPTPPPPPPPSDGCAANVTGSAPACTLLPPAPLPAGKKWNVSFSEEFSGSSLNTSKLSPCFDWNYGGCTETFNAGRERYMPSQVVVSDGTAKLIAAPLSPSYPSGACQNGQCTYKAGLLSTARPRADNGSGYLYKFTYGYVESRFKFPATQGFFTAFWMLPAEPSYNYRSEIDILELLGDDPSTMFMTYHYNNRNQSYTPNTGKFNNGACAVKNYSTDFVRMGVDWQPDHIAWYINGVKCGQFNGNASTIENGPMQLILHMMVDNNWQRSWKVGLLDPTLTRQLEVDYIRVYQQQ